MLPSALAELTVISDIVPVSAFGSLSIFLQDK
jgi:hypothetical protein